MRHLVSGCALTLTIAFCGSNAAFAQAPFPSPPAQVLLQRGLEQFRNGSLPAARHSLEQVRWLPPTLADRETAWTAPEAEGYGTLAAVLTADTEAIQKITSRWQEDMRETFFRDRIAGALSRYYFDKGEWGPAIAYGNDAGIVHHSNEELAALKFRTAYAYFNQREFDQAEALFRAMKGIEGPYQEAGYYYYGLLAYQQNRYDEALTNLQRVAGSPHYQSTVPYFLAELKYLQGDREAALADVQRLLALPEKNYYHNELELLAAHLYYDQGNYTQAAPYFESYYADATQIRRETLYEMGYTHFRNTSYREAIPRLQPVTAGDDSLAQLAASLLGDSYFKAGDKRGARNAYSLAAQSNWYPDLQSGAYLKSAALAYEDGQNAEALRLLDQMKTAFPMQAATPEARNLRAAVLLRNRNYRESLEEALAGGQATTVTPILQRAAYGYGLDLIRENRMSDADSLLRLSLRYPADAGYEAATQFWLSETAYRLGRYGEAVQHADAYLAAGAGAQRIGGNEMNAAAAALNKGYALLATERYPEAQAAFAQARSGSGRIATDAALREADMVLMQKNFAQADKLFQLAAATPSGDEDYALLQRANLAGIRGDVSGKQKMLQQILSRKPVSAYAAEARYEAGLNLLAQDRNRDAIGMLQPLATSETPFTAKAMLRTGQAHQELNEMPAAIQVLTSVVERYSGTVEQRAALEMLRGIYTEAGNPEAYAALAMKVGSGTQSGDIDSVYFTAAEANFAASRYEKAAAGYSDYLNRYPTGAFAARATYYAALSYDRNRNPERARPYYQQVLQQPVQEFTPLAAARLAELSEAAQDTSVALQAYEHLYRGNATPAQKRQAADGLLRLKTLQGDFAGAMPYADELLADSNLSVAERQQTSLFRGNLAQGLGDVPVAVAYWQTAAQSKAPAVATEALHHLASARMKEGDLSGAENTAMSAIRVNGAPEWWNVKSYLLLAEVFRRQKDYFNARATLESIVKNAKNAQLKAEAAEKLQTVRNEEKANSSTKAK